MTDHVQPNLIEAFARGDLGDHTAALVAMHLDDCPACANLAREADPLAPVFACADDPPLPAGLVAAILEADAQPAGAIPWTELAVAACLFLVAGACTWAVVAVDVWWLQARTLARGLTRGITHVPADPWLLSAVVLVGLAMLAGSAGAGRTGRSGHRGAR